MNYSIKLLPSELMAIRTHKAWIEFISGFQFQVAATVTVGSHKPQKQQLYMEPSQASVERRARHWLNLESRRLDGQRYYRRPCCGLSWIMVAEQGQQHQRWHAHLLIGWAGGELSEHWCVAAARRWRLLHGNAEIERIRGSYEAAGYASKHLHRTGDWSVSPQLNTKT